MTDMERSADQRLRHRRAEDRRLSATDARVRTSRRGLWTAIAVLFVAWIVVFAVGQHNRQQETERVARASRESVERVARESVARCQATNQLRVGITEGLRDIAKEQSDPQAFLRAAQPILRRTAPIDCANPPTTTTTTTKGP